MEKSGENKTEEFVFKITSRSERMDEFSEPVSFKCGTEIGQNDCRNFLRVSLAVGYYCLITPFKFNEVDGTIHVNKVQKTICGIGYILCLYEYISELRKFPLETLKNNPVQYFLFFQRVASFIATLITIEIFWMNSKKFQKIDSFLSSSKNLPSSNKKNWVTSKWIIMTICIIYIMMGLATHLFGIRIIKGLSYENPSYFYRRYVAEARFSLFISSRIDNSSLPKMEEITTGDQVATAFIFIADLFRNLIAVYYDSVRFFAFLTLLFPAKAFNEEIKLQLAKNIMLYREDQHSLNVPQLKASSVSNILLKYKALKHLAQLVNNTFQWMVFTFLLETVLYYSVYGNAVFVASDWYRRLRISIFSLMGFAVFTIASDFYEKVRIMRQWLSHEQVYRHFTQSELVLLLDELTLNPVCISGAVFSITYSFTGVVVTTLVTYFIICASIDVV